MLYSVRRYLLLGLRRTLDKLLSFDYIGGFHVFDVFQLKDIYGILVSMLNDVFLCFDVFSNCNIIA